MGNPQPRVSPVLSFKLIQSLKERAALKRGTSEAGASILLVLLVALILILGTATLASRSFQGLIGSVFLGQSREAAAAAELGAAFYISELNKAENRRLLVTSRNTNTPLPEDPQTALTTNLGDNLCRPINTPATTLDPAPRFVDDQGNILTAAPAGGNYNSFRLVGVRQPSQSGLSIGRARDFGILANSGTQPLFLQVEGSSFRDGVRVASMTVEKEFEVVPMCCGRSFGEEHGNDPYTDKLGNNLELGVCVPNIKDFFSFGLVAGAGPNKGDFNIVGTPTFVNDQGKDVTPLVCLNDIRTDPPTPCTSNNTSLTTNLNLEIPLPDHYCIGSNVAPTLSEAQCSSNSSYRPRSVSQMISAPGQNLVSKDASGLYQFNITTATTLPPNCTKLTTGAVDTIHCNMQGLPNNSDFTFRTSANQRIALYFPNSGVIVKQQGTNQFKNEACPAGSITGCTTPISFTDYPIKTLSIYGCITSGCTQDIKLAGSPDSLYMFIHAPYAALDLFGTSTFRGAAWVQNVKANGTTNFFIPGSGIGEILNPPDEDPLFFNWTARSTNRFRWLGN